MNEKREIAVFAAGCFWCYETIFKMFIGVESVTPGYSGGEEDHPSYHDVARGMTGHAESVEVVFNPDVISYED
ncbi:MAG: peptide-methionine (S)-S-oxide reductase [Candidatus Dojkabacteria bacterium]|nr:peptide-methionine (S)-S-oxide reductase [Candidatus Dojkabacteria bacterium]MDQ7021800.1 peptide-methionine (S)-S-oxide reductase [Candidatus Dojkabacteria bacterium]